MILHAEYPNRRMVNGGACFRLFSKVCADCRFRISQIWTIEPDPSLRGATGENSTQKKQKRPGRIKPLQEGD